MKLNENNSFNVKRTESLDSQIYIFQLPTTIDRELATTIFKSMIVFMECRKACLACNPDYFLDLFDHSPEVLDQWDPNKMISEGRTISQSGSNSWRGLSVNQLSCSPRAMQKGSFELLYSGPKSKSDNFEKKECISRFIKQILKGEEKILLLVESCLFDFEEDEIKWTDRYKSSDKVEFIVVEQVSSKTEGDKDSSDISHSLVVANKSVIAKGNFNGKRSDSSGDEDDLIFNFNL